MGSSEMSLLGRRCWEIPLKMSWIRWKSGWAAFDKSSWAPPLWVSPWGHTALLPKTPNSGIVLHFRVIPTPDNNSLILVWIPQHIPCFPVQLLQSAWDGEKFIVYLFSISFSKHPLNVAQITATNQKNFPFFGKSTKKSSRMDISSTSCWHSKAKTI